MSLPIARRVQRVKPSPTMAATARAARLRAEGRDIISLTAGEPDFDTPDHIGAAGIEAIRTGLTRYTDVGGTPALKDAIIAKFARDNELAYERAQILVSCGAKQTLFNLCMAVLDPEDEAIIPAPYWVSYPDMVMLADAHPVILRTDAEQGYKISPLQLERAITPKTRLLLLNSPSNPTGAAYTRAELAALGEVLLAHPRVLIGTDDMYEHIWWAPEPFSTIAQVVPALYERTITINGVSKSHAMTGWRIGYCGGPRAIVSAMATIQGQSTSNPSSISQHAAVTALNGDQLCVATMNEQYKRRHDFVVAGLNALPGVQCRTGEGTFYAFADISAAMQAKGLHDDVAFCDALLEQQGVAVVPGSGFGAPGHMRLSFATDLGSLERALERLRAFLSPA
ncbi:MAG: pyridoxal phosphate-dependent aminotransferase [Gammaproteobacteria bacterium]|nr:pyridoxal phosphate-dependent aminotransferase [Gammaproteobacteria bacterium]